VEQKDFTKGNDWELGLDPDPEYLMPNAVEVNSIFFIRIENY
jgi:hypothetical protein